MKNVISAGTLVVQSERGYYNFEYPNDSSMRIQESSAITRLPWRNFRGLVPVLLQNVSAIPKSYNRKVVWVPVDALRDG